MSNFDSRNSSYASKDIFFLALVQARFPDFKTTDPRSRTVIFTTKYQQNYVENLSSLDAIAAEK
jgi:hypothetical protein